MNAEPFDAILNLRISASEKQMLTELAEQDGLKISQYVRRWIRHAHRAEFGDRNLKKKGRKESSR